MTATPIDTAKALELEQSKLALFGYALLAMVMTLASGLVAFGPPSASPGSIIAGYAGMALFGFAVLFILWRMLTSKGATIVLSPRGLLDVRVAAQPIPWSSMRGLSTWTFRKQKVLVIEVDPAAEALLDLTRLARWTRNGNRAVGADGLSITMQGLKMPYDQFVGTVMAYAQAHHAPFVTQNRDLR